MGYCTEEEIRSLIIRFEDGKLEKERWTHHAHLIAAVWYCSQYPFNAAVDTIRRKIIQHNEAVGTPNNEQQGYHETITQFWMHIVSKYLEKNNNPTLLEMCRGFIESPYSHKNRIFDHYSKERIFSLKARRKFLKPDIQPFPQVDK